MASTITIPSASANAVSVATTGALTGDGTSGSKLAVSVDGVTLSVNGSNQLVAAGGVTLGDTQVAFGDGANTIGGDAGLTYTKATDTLNVDALLNIGAALSLRSTDFDPETGPYGSLVQLQPATSVLGGGVVLTGGDTDNNAKGSISLSGASDDVLLNPATTGIILRPPNIAGARSTVIISGNLALATGYALRPDTTVAHTLLIQAYDVDGDAYVTFVTLTNGDAPALVIAPPAGGGTVSVRGSFKSVDDTAGATAGPFTVMTGIQVKNGLVTTLTGS